MERLGLSEYLEGWPKGDMFHRGNAKGHATNAGNLISEWYTESTKHDLMQFYERDYAVFNRFDDKARALEQMPRPTNVTIWLHRSVALARADNAVNASPSFYFGRLDHNQKAHVCDVGAHARTWIM